MIGYSWKAEAGKWFDTSKVLAAERRAERRWGSRVGAFVRQRARSSIRPRKRISEPGAPPSQHTPFLKNFILFAWDDVRRSTVIGAVPLGGGRRAMARVIEHGGEETDLRGKTRHYRARPFMGPALQAEVPSLAPPWRDSIRG